MVIAKLERLTLDNVDSIGRDSGPGHVSAELDDILVTPYQDDEYKAWLKVLCIVST